MHDIIRLLPDSVANQIAAGEVIQRPASAAKELLENAIDAGATLIKLVIKDSGKTLIQVVDNGCGMSMTDARMSFERHATSKIKTASDLFAIKTMGFRGEALASIAAIAQIELKTKRVEDELGSQIIIEGSKVIDQKPTQCANGTSIAIKNLFFNVPARRNFLKSNQVETRHIIDEFTRVSMVNPLVSFTMHHNEKAIFQLNNSTLKQRISGLLGANFSQRLIPVEQDTESIKINGFIGKPEFARKTRGEQFFFANNRFIKHPYLHHSIDAAFQELLPKDTFPSYFIFIEVDPKTIDINIHPTKTEVNFQDSKVLYAILRAAVRQSLGKFSITPTLDFDVEQSLDFTDPPKGKIINPPKITTDPTYNPFDTQTRKDSKHFSKSKTTNWESLYADQVQIAKPDKLTTEDNDLQKNIDSNEESQKEVGEIINEKIFQFKNRYIVTVVSSGLMIIDQNLAHERILFERFSNLFENEKASSQQELFPETLSFSASDAEILNDIKDELSIIGFAIKPMSKNTFVITGRPADLTDFNLRDTLEGIIENYRKNLLDINLNKKINLAKSMAANVAIEAGTLLKKEEINAMVDALFACKAPTVSPSGKAIFNIISMEEIAKKFN